MNQPRSIAVGDEESEVAISAAFASAAACVNASNVEKLEPLFKQYPNLHKLNNHQLAVQIVRSGSAALLVALYNHDSGVYSRALDNVGNTLLHVVPCCEDDSTYRYILKCGANVNARNDRGETPLMVAARDDASWAVFTLLEKGAEKNARDKRGRTAVDHALLRSFIKRRSNIEIARNKEEPAFLNAKILLEAGVPCDNPESRTIRYALAKRPSETIGVISMADWSFPLTSVPNPKLEEYQGFVDAVEARLQEYRAHVIEADYRAGKQGSQHSLRAKRLVLRKVER